MRSKVCDVLNDNRMSKPECCGHGKGNCTAGSYQGRENW